MPLREGPAAPALSRVGARAMAANKGLGFIWNELSTPGRQNLPTAGPVTPGFGRSFRSAWSEGADGPQRRPAGPGMVPGGLQAFLGQEAKKPVAGWKLDRSQQQFGFRPQVPGANPAPPRPAEPKGMPAPPGLPRAKAPPVPPRPEVPLPGVAVRSTDRLTQLMENSRRHMDRLLAEGQPTARQLLEARMARARLARSMADEAARAEKQKGATPEPAQRVRTQADTSGNLPAARPAKVHGKAEVSRPEKPAPAAQAPAPAGTRIDVARPTSEPPKPAARKPVEPKAAEPPQAESPTRPAEPVRSAELSRAEPPKPEPPAAPPEKPAEPGRAENRPPESPRRASKTPEPEAARPAPAPAEAPEAKPAPRPKEPTASEPAPRAPEPPRAEPLRAAEQPRSQTLAQPAFGGGREVAPSPPPAPTATPTPTPTPAPPQAEAPRPAPESARGHGPRVDRTVAPRDLPTQTPTPVRSEPRSVVPVEAEARRQPPVRETTPPPPAVRAPVDPRRDRPPVEPPRESEASKEERAVRTRGSEVTPIPGQPRRTVQEEPFHKNVRESGRTRHEHEQEQGHEESEDEQQQGKGGKGKEVERKRPPAEQQKGKESSSTDPQKQQQAARKLTQTRESFQMALRKLEALSQARASETVATRNAAQAIGTLLKKAYREQELQSMDEESAVNALGLLLKIGGEETYNHSARVLELALGLADEIGADAQTRQATKQGALLKDLGDVGQAYRGQSDEALEELGGFLSRQDLRKASLLQDIGNLRVPREILARRGQLTVDEMQIMKMHPVYGAEMVRPIVSLRHLCPIIRGHHERWDGKGYPDGLRAEQIPLPARIIAIADLFDALRTERPHKAGLPPGEAWEILSEGSGTHFDPWLVEAFGRVLKRRYPAAGA